MSMAQRWIDDHLATVCIDQYDDSVLRGRLYHRSIDGGRVFRSTIQLLMEMERILSYQEKLIELILEKLMVKSI